MVRNPQRLAPPLALAGTVPWWGVASSVFAPIILIGGWTVAADLQPVPFNAIQRSISALGAVGMPYRWVIAATLLGVGVCHATTGIALRPAAEAAHTADGGHGHAHAHGRAEGHGHAHAHGHAAGHGDAEGHGDGHGDGEQRPVAVSSELWSFQIAGGSPGRR